MTMIGRRSVVGFGVALAAGVRPAAAQTGARLVCAARCSQVPAPGAAPACPGESVLTVSAADCAPSGRGTC